jgi:hypothetical protein
MSLADACLVRLSEMHRERRIFTPDEDFRIHRPHGNKVIPLLMPEEEPSIPVGAMDRDPVLPGSSPYSLNPSRSHFQCRQHRIVRITLRPIGVERVRVGRVERGVPGEAVGQVGIGEEQPAKGDRVRFASPKDLLGGVASEPFVGHVKTSKLTLQLRADPVGSE